MNLQISFKHGQSCLKPNGLATARLAQTIIQEYNLLFPIPKNYIIFINHHLLFQNQYFFLVNSSNLMDTIKTIIVLIELKLNYTVNS